MAVDTGVQDLHVDSNVLGRERDGSFSSILKARDDTKSNITQQAQSLHETTTAMGQLNSQMQVFIESLKDANNEVKKTQAYKDFNKALKTFNTSFNDASLLVNRGSTNLVTLTKNVEKSNNAYDEMSLALEELQELYDAETKSVRTLSKARQKELELEKADLRNRKAIRSQQSQQILAEAREGNKSALTAIQNQAGKLQNVLTNIKQALSFDKLIEASGINSSAKVQLSTMRSMGLSKSEFNSFKHSLYDRIDTQVYSSEQVVAAIDSLESMGINSTAEAIDKMDTIIRGQNLLGMSAEQQAKLQALGNKTGRDELTFTTNKMAKWMAMSTNIGKKQLSELVDLNTSFKTQFADLGITSEEFYNMTDSATAALTALTGDTSWATKYTDVLTNLVANTDATHQLTGMTSGELKEKLAAGTGFGSILESSTGTLNDLYRQFMSNPNETEKNLNYIAPELGIDTQTASLIRLIAQQGGGSAFDRYVSSFNVNGNDSTAIEQIEKSQKDAMSETEKKLNEISNWKMNKFDWVVLSKLESWLTTIISLLGVIASISVFKDLGSLGKSLFGKAGGTGLGGLLKSASLTAGLAWTASDAISGYNSTATEMYGENASTGQRVVGGLTSAVSGSKVHRTSSGNVDMGQNIGRGALSGAAKGALIGTYFGGPAGAAIGGAIGGIAGAIGGWWKGKKAKEQEQREKEELELQKKIQENTAKTAEAQAITNAQLSLANRTAKVRPYTGVGASARAISHTATSTGKGASYPWPINSGFNDGRVLSNGDSSMHLGVDFGVAEGTPLGSPVNGRVTSVGTDPRNTYYNDYGLSMTDRYNAGLGVNILGNDGKVYQLWHLSKLGVSVGDTVKAGQTVGLSGNSGYSTGAHLHYGTQVNGVWVDPISNNLVHSGLFSADGKFVSTSNSESSTSDSMDYSAPTTSIFQNKLRYISSLKGMGAVVNGLADIKNTLIELSNKQSRDEKIMTMLQQNKKQDPRTN